jgi:hypothetical protein
MVFNLGQCGEAEVRQARHLADLDFVHVVVAAQQQQPDLRLGGLARLIERIGSQYQRLDGGLQWNAQQLGHVGAGGLAGGGRPGHGL